jgi:hypothetical protein
MPGAQAQSQLGPARVRSQPRLLSSQTGDEQLPHVECPSQETLTEDKPHNSSSNKASMPEPIQFSILKWIPNFSGSRIRSTAGHSQEITGRIDPSCRMPGLSERQIVVHTRSQGVRATSTSGLPNRGGQTSWSAASWSAEKPREGPPFRPGCRRAVSSARHRRAQERCPPRGHSGGGSTWLQPGIKRLSEFPLRSQHSMYLTGLRFGSGRRA